MYLFFKKKILNHDNGVQTKGNVKINTAKHNHSKMYFDSIQVEGLTTYVCLILIL